MALEDRNDTSNTIDTSDNRFGHLLDAVNKLKNNISSNENSWGYLLSAANQVDAVEEQVNKKICYDMITLGEEGINDYLLKDKNNFVIKKLNYPKLGIKVIFYSNSIFIITSPLLVVS